MIRRKLTRRQMLLAGMAGLGSLVAARDLRGSPSSGAAAAAAGTLTIGGDLTVNRMGFGAMRLTGEGIWGEPKDPAEARRVLRRAVELGVNFIDTADAYGPEVNERLIAETLHPYPRGLVIATKGGQTRPSAGQWVPDGRPEHLREACEGSLKRLKLERIDLYQFHWPDPKVPVEDSVGELARLRTEGKIRHVGVSNFSADELQRVRKHRPDRLGTESLQRRGPRLRGRAHGLHTRGDRLHSVGADRTRLRRETRLRRTRSGRETTCHKRVPGGDRVAAGEVARDAADSRNVVSRTRRGKCRGRAPET